MKETPTMTDPVPLKEAIRQWFEEFTFKQAVKDVLTELGAFDPEPVCANCNCPVGEHIPVAYNGGPWERAVCRNCLCDSYSDGEE